MSFGASIILDYKIVCRRRRRRRLLYYCTRRQIKTLYELTRDSLSWNRAAVDAAIIVITILK